MQQVFIGTPGRLLTVCFCSFSFRLLLPGTLGGYPTNEGWRAGHVGETSLVQLGSLG